MTVGRSSHRLVERLANSLMMRRILPTIERGDNPVTPYRLSFTVGGLLSEYARIGVDAFDDTGSWVGARKLMRGRNLLQVPTASSATRITSELVDRLSVLSAQEIEVVRDGTADDRATIMWVATARYYRIIFEFASEVVRSRFLARETTLRLSDIDAFFARLSGIAPEVAGLSEGTRLKLRQNLMRMLREASIVDTSGTIQPALPSVQVSAALAASGPDSFLVLPMSDELIARMMG